VPVNDPRTDLELVDAMNAGDVAAFEALYARHRDWVARQARRFTGDDDDALDVLQETFRYLLGKFPGFELRARLTTFLYPAIRNLAITQREKKRPIPVDDEVLQAEPDRAGTESGSGADSREELAHVLAGLSEVHREVVLLRFVDDFSLEEISVALEIPSGTVKSRLHNALRALREDSRARRYFDRDDETNSS